MVSVNDISKDIKELYEKLHFLSEKLTGGEVIAYPSLLNLFDEFSDLNKEWRYYFKIQSPKILSNLIKTLDSYNLKPDSNLLQQLDILAKDLILQLGQVRRGTSIWQGGELEKEKNIQIQLELMPLSLELKAELLDLKDGFKDLNLQRVEIEADHQKTIKAQLEAIRIIDELKTKNEAYSQIIDEDSNVRIRVLYDEIYSLEIKLADKYRNWALLIFVVIGTFLLLGFLNLSIQNWNHLRDDSYIHIPFGWDSLLKTLMLFSLTTPAWYLTQESSKHRKVAYKAKMLGTELSSFPLYAREFKDEDRLELRKSLADRFFGQELYNGSSNSKNSNDVSIEQVKLIAEANKALAESLKIKQNLG